MSGFNNGQPLSWHYTMTYSTQQAIWNRIATRRYRGYPSLSHREQSRLDKYEERGFIVRDLGFSDDRQLAPHENRMWPLYRQATCDPRGRSSVEELRYVSRKRSQTSRLPRSKAGLSPLFPEYVDHHHRSVAMAAAAASGLAIGGRPRVAQRVPATLSHFTPETYAASHRLLKHRSIDNFATVNQDSNIVSFEEYQASTASMVDMAKRLRRSEAPITLATALSTLNNHFKGGLPIQQQR